MLPVDAVKAKSRAGGGTLNVEIANVSLRNETLKDTASDVPKAPMPDSRVNRARR